MNSDLRRLGTGRGSVAVLGGFLVLGALTACGGDAEPVTPTVAPSSVTSSVESTSSVAPTTVETPAPETQEPAAAPEPAPAPAVAPAPAPVVVPQTQAPAPAAPPTLTLPGLEPRAGY